MKEYLVVLCETCGEEYHTGIPIYMEEVVCINKCDESRLKITGVTQDNGEE